MNKKTDPELKHYLDTQRALRVHRSAVQAFQCAKENRDLSAMAVAHIKGTDAELMLSILRQNRPGKDIK